MPTWKKFSGSKEQISEMMSAKDGFKWRDINGKESNIVSGSSAYALMLLYHKTDDANPVHEYMLCNLHPHAEMIIEWARTGREVYFFDSYNQKWVESPNPLWRTDAKYSFNPDGE